ncbi:hypothetical protein HID58_056845, partial [Brassica napus]
CFSSSPKETYLMLLFLIAFFTLRFLSLVVFKVVFLVVGLPLILSSRLGFQDMVFAFIAVCVSVTFSFAMFATPGLDNVLLRVCSVDLEDCFWSQVWAHVSRGLASVLPHSCCSLLPLLPLSLGDLVSSIPSFVVLHRHRRLVCACLVCEINI